MTPIDLTQLPAPAILEIPDFETLLAQRKTALLEQVPESIRAEVATVLQYDSEPLSIQLQENCYREILLRQRINEACQAVMLSHATGTDLDNVLARFNLDRLVVQEADPTATPPVEAIMETDDAFRLRGLGAFDTLSVAGPASAYIQFVRNASGKVADVSAISPAPCDVLISVLSTEGSGTASAELLSIVTAAVNDEDVRPIGDRVTVQTAGIVDYTITATLYFYPGPETPPLLAAAQASAEAYVATQRRLGRDIRRSAIYAALHVAGVQRVELASPAADIVLDATQAGYCSAITLNSGGTDE